MVEGGAETNGACLAAQAVDELRALVAPALDGAEHVQDIVDYRNGLAGVVRLQFNSAEVLDHGVVQLAGRVAPRPTTRHHQLKYLAIRYRRHIRR